MKKKSDDTAKPKTCKDCGGGYRPAPYPGPRCATHHRERKKKNRGKSRNSYLQRTYSIAEDRYNQILESQGGTCFICGPVTGRNGSSKKLSVDHDHSCCNGSTSCGECVRAVLCTNCNRNILGHLRDSVEALERAIEVIQDPPAQRIPNDGV